MGKIAYADILVFVWKPNESSRHAEERDGAAPRLSVMLKIAAVLLALMVLFGILGFVVDVAGAITKVAFFVCLIALGVSLAAKALKRSG
jgi:hypothetical protein